jgi:Hint domain
MSGSWTKSTVGYTTQGNWISVASNSTGQKCIASNDQDTNIWVSSDYGVSWSISPSSPTSVHWGGVTISQSGNKMAACEDVGGATYNVYFLDTTGSNTWTNIATSGTNAPGNSIQWTSVCFSMNENTLAACDGNAIIWIYNIATNTWTNPPNASGYPPRGNVVSSNVNGFVSIATNNWINTIYGGPITYVSTTIDQTNSNINTFLPNNPNWSSISSSFDGTVLVACAEASNYIYVGTVSSNYWTFVQQTAAGTGEWKVVATGPDAVSIAACNGDGANPGEIWVGYRTYGSSSYTWTKQTQQSGQNLNADWKSISRSTDKNQFTKFVAVPKLTNPGEQTGIWVFTSFQTAADSEQPPPLTCFNKDTKILTNNGYVEIQNLNRGDLVKTICNDFIPIHSIGYKEIINPCVKDQRIKDQLYKCSTEKYPEVFEDLIITGCHAILVDYFNEGEREKVVEVLGDAYVTDKKYRLPACVDKRADIYEQPGKFTIYHIALDHEDYYMNYGIYANGLVVETCSKRYLKELSDMTLI